MKTRINKPSRAEIRDWLCEISWLMGIATGNCIKVTPVKMNSLVEHLKSLE